MDLSLSIAATEGVETLDNPPETHPIYTRRYSGGTLPSACCVYIRRETGGKSLASCE